MREQDGVSMMLPDHGRPAPLLTRMVAGEDSSCLLVDDDVLYLSFLAEVFRSRGYRTLTASGGGAALRLARRHGPTFVLLDIGMPGPDGFEVLRALRRHDATRAALIVMLSGRDRAADIFAALHGGADDYVVEPIRPDDLVDRVHALLWRGDD